MEDGSDLALKPRRINMPVQIAPVVRAAARSSLLAALLSRNGGLRKVSERLSADA
jgi:hypothetical protein